MELKPVPSKKLDFSAIKSGKKDQDTYKHPEPRFVNSFSAALKNIKDSRNKVEDVKN